MRRDPTWGDLDLLDTMRRGRAKGNLVAWRPRWVKERFGEPAVQSLAAGVPTAAAELLFHPPSAFAWVDMGLLMDIDRAIVLKLMDGDVGRMRAFGADIGLGDMSGLYKLVIRLAVSPSLFIKKFMGMWDTYFQPGTVRLVTAEGTHARIQLEGHVLPLNLCGHGLPGFVEAGLALTGHPELKVGHPECRHQGHAACVWEW